MTQTAAAIGGGNVIVQVQGDGDSIVAGLPHLALTQHGGLTRRINTDAHTRNPREIDILRAYTRSIEIVGREIEIGALHAWLGTLEPIAVHVMTGGAGYGKTRLALELVDEMALKGWRTAHEGFGHVLALGSDVLAFNIAETERSRVRNVVMSSGVPASLAPLVDHLIAVATLRQGLSYQAAVDVIEQESAATGYHLPMGPAALRDGLAEALPDGAGGIAPVTPDLIGGALLLSVWDHDDAVALHAIDRSYQAEPLEVAASIIRTCTDYVIRERRRPLEWLKRIRTHNAHELNA